MKKIFVFTFLFLVQNSWAQVFHFDQDSTAIIKNVNQSPAHWYLEILNDLGMDTTLRWKCHFDNIPTQWDANFDDQNTFYTTLLDGDSADFVLYGGLSLPQKLIIGAAFNNTPGVGSYFFDIYDPETPNDITTIEYHYIVGQADLQEIPNDLIIKRTGETVHFDHSLVGKEILVCTFAGRTVYQGLIKNALQIPLTREGLIYKVVTESRQIILKEFL